MTLFAFGLNHNTAPLDLRERVNFPARGVPDALRALCRIAPVTEGVILSTCNRTEIYCSLDSDDRQPVYQWFCDWHDLDREQLAGFCYWRADEQAVRHLLRVASGLDSMVLGEPQILGQLKGAYQTASKAGSTGRLLARLFQHSFRVARQVRRNTAIGGRPVSVALAAVRKARQVFGPLDAQTALLIGAGEFAGLAAWHLREQGLQRMIFANRSPGPAQRLADRYQGYAISLASFPSFLADADIVISSTGSRLPILDREAVAQALTGRGKRPMLLLDMALPRDIEPQARELQGVQLYTIDDLRDPGEDGLHSQREAARQAERLIDNQVDHFCSWMQALGAAATIRALRGQAEQQSREIVQAALGKLRGGGDPEQLLQDLAHKLRRKLLHHPTTRLSQAGSEGRDELLRACRELFLLDEMEAPGEEKGAPRRKPDPS